MKKIIIPLLAVLTMFSCISYSRAQEATSTINETEEKVNQIKEAVEAKVENTSGLKKRAFFGEVVDIFNQSVVIQANNNKRTIHIDEEAVIVDEKRTALKFEDLEIGGYLIAMGYLDDTDKLEAKRIVVSTEPKKETRTAVIGRVTNTNKNSLSLKPLSGAADFDINSGSKTVINQKTGSENMVIEFEEIQLEAVIIVIGVINSDNEINATKIHVINNPRISPTTSPETLSASEND